MRLVVFSSFVIDEQKRRENNTSSHPIHSAGILGTQYHLSDQRQRDSHGYPDCHHQWCGQEESICPCKIADEGYYSVHLNHVNWWDTYRRDGLTRTTVQTLAVGGNTNGSTPVQWRMNNPGHRKMRLKNPTSPKNRGMFTRSSLPTLFFMTTMYIP